MEEKVKCSIRIPASIVQRLSDEAERSGKSFSTCVVDKLQRSRGSTSGNAQKLGWIGVEQCVKREFMRRADQIGLSASDYLLRLMEPAPPVNISIPFRDLDRDTIRIDELIRTINGICKVSLRSGDTYAQDVDTMIRTLRSILDEYLEIHRILNEDRSRLYEEAISLIRQATERDRAAERKRKSRNQHGSDKDQGISQ